MKKIILGFLTTLMFWGANAKAESVVDPATLPLEPKEIGLIMEKLEMELGADRLEQLLTPETTEAIEYYVNNGHGQLDPHNPYAATPAAMAAGAVGGAVAAAVDYAWDRVAGRFLEPYTLLSEISDQEFDLVLNYRDKTNYAMKAIGEPQLVWIGGPFQGKKIVPDIITHQKVVIGPVQGGTYVGGKKMIPTQVTFVAPNVTKAIGEIPYEVNTDVTEDSEFDYVEVVNKPLPDPKLVIFGKQIGFDQSRPHPNLVGDDIKIGTKAYMGIRAQQGSKVPMTKYMKVATHKAGEVMNANVIQYANDVNLDISPNRVKLISETTDIIEAYNRNHRLDPISPVAATPAVAAGAAAGALAYKAVEWGLNKAFGSRVMEDIRIPSDMEFDLGTSYPVRY